MTGYKKFGALLWTATLALAIPASAQDDAINEAAAPPTQETADEEHRLLPWLTSLEAGRRDALARRRPVLVRVGAAWCGWCEKLTEEIEKKAVQAELARWTLVEIDSKQSPQETRQLTVSGIPALRVLTPLGRFVASRDGYLSEEDLLAWLQAQYAAASEAPDAALFSDEEPTLTETLRLVRLFRERDATLREAAVQRLLPFPHVARQPVVQALREGNLSSRLAALELLDAWQAPVEEIDPWRPETLTASNLAAVDRWAEETAVTDAPEAPEALTAAALAEAREQIDRLLQVEPAEAAAIGERLARYGARLLPEVAARLPDATRDEDRERLLALRYRLAANRGLTLRWPGGIQRLASTEASIRRQAAEELASLADAASQPLLLELFSDPDPLVRELSLRGLRALGGDQALEALGNLLDDPEPNVRAAVLKQLAEDAPAEMLPTVAAYVTHETDPDLIVHAIRYLREVQDSTTSASLLPLLEHESWRVRAEAAEALGNVIDASRNYSNHGLSEEGAGTAEIYAALYGRLADEDAFVVSRTLEALDDVDAEEAVEPLVAAADKHPQVTPQVVALLAGGGQMRVAALPHLRRFFESDNPTARAAAVSGLCTAAPEQASGVLLSALADEQTRVRIAAAEAFLKMMESLRSQSENGQNAALRDGSAFADYGEAVIEEAPAAAEMEEPPASDPDAMLQQFYAGQLRETWTNDLIEPLEKMLSATSDEERLAAAKALIPLGRRETALPVINEMAESRPDLAPAAGQILKWLTWSDRLALYERLYAAARNDDDRASLIYSVSEVQDRRLLETLLNALEPGSSRTLVQAVMYGVKLSYFGQRYYDLSSLTARQRREAAADMRPRADAGPPLRRLAAASLLVEVAPDEAAAAAESLMNDDAGDESLRGDAFYVFLAAQSSSDRLAAAVAALDEEDDRRRNAALRYLAIGDEALSHLPGSGLSLEIETHYSGEVRVGYNQPIVPVPPKRLRPEQVRALLDHPDPEIAAYSGYLLALFEEPEGLTPLLRHWRSLPEPSDHWDRVAYRAAAALNDTSLLPMLREIYGRLDEYSKSDFYWTVRIMSGPEILQFRRQIRREVGMDNLQ